MQHGRALALTLALSGSLALVSCGGGGGGSSTPTAPSGGGGGGGTNSTVTINIQKVNGKNSFDPNPATVGGGQVVAFKNNDVVTHHIVLDDGSGETADIPPGATSQTISIGTNKSYHCKNHPSMVGSFNGNATPEPPPCTGYCG
jgi:plastocyanin